MYVAEALRLRYFFIGRPPKCHHAPSGDHFEEAFFVRRPYVAAVDAHRDRAIGRGLFLGLHSLAVEQVELPLLSSSSSILWAVAWTCRRIVSWLVSTGNTLGATAQAQYRVGEGILLGVTDKGSLRSDGSLASRGADRGA